MVNEPSSSSVNTGSLCCCDKLRSFYRRHRKACLVVGVVAGVVITARTASLAFRLARRARINAYLKSLEPDMVHLFMHRRWSHGPNFFPHCVKVEAFLRLSKIPYVVHFLDNASEYSPNGRMPFIVHNDTVLADGEFIIQYLCETFEVGVDDWLTPAEHAKGRMTRHLVETSINYGLNRTTFVDFPKYMVHMFAMEYDLQPAMASLLVRSMRKATITVLDATGYGSLSDEQYETQFLRDLQSLEAILSDKHFVLGQYPSSYDCSVYAWLQVAGEMGPNGPALSFLAASSVLRNYINRMTELCFPDIAALSSHGDLHKFIPP